MLRHALQLIRRQKSRPLAWSCTIWADTVLLGGSPTAAAPFAAAPAVSANSINVWQQSQASTCSITSKVHKRSDEGNEQLLQQHAAVSEFLQKLGLSFSAMMAVLKQCEKRPLNLEVAHGRIKQLQEYFGQSMASDMLTLAPILLTRDINRLLAYYEGLIHVLGSEKLALTVVKKMPDVMQHKPEMVEARIQAMQEMLQVDRASILSLVRKGPTVLRMNSKKLQPHIDFLSEVAGLTPPEVYKALHSWPVLASTTNKLMRERYKAVSQLLQATPEDMRRICRVHPNVLGRDPAQLSQNIESLANKLQLPKDELVDMLRREPGLLSWNVSTVINRIIAASQVLKLTPKLSLTLLTYHRPLISVVSQLPQRLEALRRILGVTDAELYPMVYKHLSIMRFPIESNEAKLACVGGLARLHPAWAEACKTEPPGNKLRMLQAGWSCHWRIVYLVHTGQQGSCSVMKAIRMPHAKFREQYPDYTQWLDRYNEAVSATDIPLAVDGSVDLIGPSIYQAVIADASLGRNLHAGSLYLRQRVKQAQLGVSNGQLQQATWLLSAASRSTNESDSDSRDGSSSNTSVTSSPQQQAEDASSSMPSGSVSAGVKRVLPATPTGRLAAWLDIDYSVAERLLSHKQLGSFKWSEWQTRLEAAGSYLGAAAHCAAGAGGEQGGRHSSCSGRPAAAVAGVAAFAVQPTAMADVTSNPLLYGTASSPVLHAVPDQAEQQHVQEQHRRQQGQLQQHQQQGQQQRQQPVVEFSPHPLGQEVLQHALSTRHAAAVAAVSVACLSVPFSQQLFSMPPKPPDPVVQYILQHSDVFAGKFFADTCRRLARMVWASTALQQQMQQLSPEQVAKLPGCISTRLKYLYYLVQTQQPLPWVFRLEVLLYDKKRESGYIRQKFFTAYPDYEQWEKFHMQEL